MNVDYKLNDFSIIQKLIDVVFRTEIIIQTQKTKNDFYMIDQNEKNEIVLKISNLLNFETNSVLKISDVFNEKQSKFETKIVLIKIQIFIFRTMKFARNKKHRSHSTTSKNERNANRQKLKKMINQNLLTTKKNFF